MALRSEKPKFGSAVLWGACSRCNARVRHSTLRKERLTGLLVCTEASGRDTSPCWDPWPEVFDFQAFPDKSIEPPAEPLPLRYNLDDIWGSGNNPAPAPDDATRLNALLKSVPYYAMLGKSAAFPPVQARVSDQVANLTTINPADYDGTFLPSTSIRTVTPPSEEAELAAVNATDIDMPGEQIWTPPWSVQKGV